jgi:hypothetical protein
MVVSVIGIVRVTCFGVGKMGFVLYRLDPAYIRIEFFIVKRLPALIDHRNRLQQISVTINLEV